MRYLQVGFLFAAASLVSGCGPDKLHETRTYSLEPGEAKSLIMPKQSKPQKITVIVESPTEVDVFVADIKEVDPDKLADFSMLSPEKQKSKSIVSKNKVTKETVTADIPAGTEYSVIVGNTKEKADVKVEVTNKK